MRACPIEPRNLTVGIKRRESLMVKTRSQKDSDETKEVARFVENRNEPQLGPSSNASGAALVNEPARTIKSLKLIRSVSLSEIGTTIKGK